MNTWRYLPYSVHTGAENMAIDEAILLEMAQSPNPQPVLRFYGWQPATLTLGYAQSYHKEVNEEACLQEGIDVVRRPTGGRAVLHQYELTYSLIVPENVEQVKGSVLESYLKISEPLLLGLKAVGVNAEIISQGSGHGKGAGACFDAASWYELVVGGKKLVGSAQVRKEGILLQHGSIILHFEPEFLFRLLKIPNEDVRQRLLVNFKSKACALDEVWSRPVAKEELEREICRAFAETMKIEWEASELSLAEKTRVRQLVEKYKSREWTQHR